MALRLSARPPLPRCEMRNMGRCRRAPAGCPRARRCTGSARSQIGSPGRRRRRAGEYGAAGQSPWRGTPKRSSSQRSAPGSGTAGTRVADPWPAGLQRRGRAHRTARPRRRAGQNRSGTSRWQCIARVYQRPSATGRSNRARCGTLRHGATTNCSSACATPAPSAATISSPSSRSPRCWASRSGVAALIMVLSVMNGFQKELRTRILGVASHVQISGPGELLADWQAVAQKASSPIRTSWPRRPTSTCRACSRSTARCAAALVRGILPEREEQGRRNRRAHEVAGSLEALKPGEFGIVLGAELARALAVAVGDKVTLIAPQGQVTPAGILPRLKQFRVVGSLRDRHVRIRFRARADPPRGRAEAVPHGRRRCPGVRLKLHDLFQSRRGGARPGRAARRRPVHHRLDAQPRQFLPRGADREERDVHHPAADRRGGRVQHRLHAGDGGHRQAARHRHPAHAGRDARGAS